MLWQMRAEEEHLSPVEAQDAVLRDNLFGLELDPRCVQIAMMAVALAAWKAGGGWRELPTPNVACSGIPVKAPVDDWKALADGDERVQDALVRLHILFREADTLGSLIDPKRATEVTDPTGLQQSFDDVEWEEVVPLLERAAARETDDPATAVLGADAASIARAAEYLSRKYTLVTTNVPYLTRNAHSPVLAEFGATQFTLGKHDLATIFLLRALSLLDHSGAVYLVCAQNWLFMPRYEGLRRHLLADRRWGLLARLGEGAFRSSQAAGAFVCLLGIERGRLADDGPFVGLDAEVAASPNSCAEALRTSALIKLTQQDQLANPDSRVLLDAHDSQQLLMTWADSRYGLRSGDSNRFIRRFWELKELGADWRLHQGTPNGPPYSGRESALRWSMDGGLHDYAALGIASLQGEDAWGRHGVVVKLTRELTAALYTGESFDNNVAVVWPRNERDLPALWAFMSSSEYTPAVRRIDQALKVMSATLLKVPFDVEQWRGLAKERFQDGLPEPWSDDPTQWLFEGRPEVSTAPLQVAVARLLEYRWPEQPETDDLDGFADTDGIVCLPSVAGEPPAADRVQRLLAAAYGVAWSPAMVKQLLEASGSKQKNLADWLRDDFFKQHSALFGNRPFIWHIWDGLRDGFSALVNYHRLDRKNLEKLTYTYLGTDWVERQRAGVRDDVAGAEARLEAAERLRAKLEKILEGEAPFDIFVRWKESHEQPIGWEPDLNDGVRLNIRPFVEAGVLRSRFNIHWRKDRGKNPDGSERHNDVHLTLAEKQASRQKAGRA